MAANTLEEELVAQGIVASYTWKPNRLYAKNGNTFVPVDSISDGTSTEVAAVVSAAGDEQIEEIEALGAEKLATLRTGEDDYEDVKASLITAYGRLSSYFSTHGAPAVASILDSAIADLNNLP